MTFKELGLTPALLRAVSELDYVTPTPIQQQAIPPVLAGRDLIGCAQTGTGKTAAFAVPILQRLQNGPARAAKNSGPRPIRALVLTPTRELALQIKESFDAYGRYLPFRNTVVFGGVGQNPQVAALKSGVDVLVATPGRLNDLIGQGYIDLSRVEYFVLDEADRMLDMGFIHDVRKVLAQLPAKEQRQTLLFSATMPAEIEQLAQQILTDPIEVAVTPVASTVDTVEQRVYKVDKANKRYLLADLLADKSLDSVLVFTRTKHGADRVVKELAREGFEAMAIHGNKSQNARQTALDSFKNGRIRILVATDIAARGIDINELACVVNYDLPNIPETYVHRIGRTARAGRSGLAVSFCMYEELAYLKDIEKLIQKKIPEITDHPYPMQVFTAEPKAERAPRPPREGGSAPRGEAAAPDGGRLSPWETPARKPAPRAEHRLSEWETPAPRRADEVPFAGKARQVPAEIQQIRTLPQSWGRKSEPRPERPEHKDRPDRAEHPERAEHKERAARPAAKSRPQSESLLHSRPSRRRQG